MTVLHQNLQQPIFSLHSVILQQIHFHAQKVLPLLFWSSHLGFSCKHVATGVERRLLKSVREETDNGSPHDSTASFEPTPVVTTLLLLACYLDEWPEHIQMLVRYSIQNDVPILWKRSFIGVFSFLTTNTLPPDETDFISAFFHSDDRSPGINPDLNQSFVPFPNRLPDLESAPIIFLMSSPSIDLAFFASVDFYSFLLLFYSCRASEIGYLLQFSFNSQPVFNTFFMTSVIARTVFCIPITFHRKTTFDWPAIVTSHLKSLVQHKHERCFVLPFRSPSPTLSFLKKEINHMPEIDIQLIDNLSTWSQLWRDQLPL